MTRDSALGNRERGTGNGLVSGTRGGGERARRLVSLGACVLLAGCTPGARTPPRHTPTEIAFLGVHVVPMAGEYSILEDHTVLVRDGQIAAVGPAASLEVPAGAQRIDARGRYLMPGLVDAHVHLEHFDTPHLLALFLAHGVTSVRNMDGCPYLLDWRRRIVAGELAGPTIHTSGPILDGDPPARDDNTVVRTASEARAAVAAQDSAGYDFVKVYTNLAPETYRAILEDARLRGRRVAGHVPRRVTLEAALDGGQHALEHLTDFDELVEADSSSVRGRFHWSKLHLAMAADTAKMTQAARRVAASGTWVVPTMIQAERAVAAGDSIRAWLAAPEVAYIPAAGRELWEGQARRISARLDSADWKVVARGQANRRAMVGALRAAGARIAIGTDTPNAFVVPGVSVHQELALLVASGFSAREALAAATSEAFQLMGASRDAGTVEAGRRADLLLLQDNPLAHLDNVRRPLGVMVRGRWMPAAVLEELLQRRPGG